MAYCCPKSVRACAIRITRLNTSGVPLDPLGAETRLLTSGFMELSLSPDYLNGESLVTRSMGGEVVIVDNDFDVLLGFNLRLKMCGVPEAALAMLIGAESLPISGMALPDLKRFACRDPLMIEMWSKNVAADACLPGGLPGTGTWVHWLLPRTTLWKLDSDLAYTSGALEFSLSGYGTQNPGWFPSNPDPALGAFPSYVPGGGDLAGWPTGPAPVAPNPLMSLDAWTLGDVDAIRDSGPLVWKCVDALPFPLDDCGYVPGGCDEPVERIIQSFVGPVGDPPVPPWGEMGYFEDAGILAPIGPLGVIPAETFQTGLLPTPGLGFSSNCGCVDNALTATLDGVVRITEAGFVSVPVTHEYERNSGTSGNTLFNLQWDAINGWAMRFTGIDWTLGVGVTPGGQWVGSLPLASPLVPQNGDEYRVVVTLPNGANTVYVVGYLNGVEVGRVSWQAANDIGVGTGWLFDQFAPPCYPTGAYGSAIDPLESMWLTVTDNGSNSYTILLDDPNQSGFLSDPLGPANNAEGATTECLPNGAGAPCATNTSTGATVQSFTVVSDASTRSLTGWPGYIVGGTGVTPSGTGAAISLDWSLTDAQIATSGFFNQSFGASAAGFQMRAALQQWVTDFGSGVPVEVKAASSTAVECLANLFPLGASAYPSARGVGFLVTPDAFSEIPMSSVTAFKLECKPFGGQFPSLVPTLSLVS